MPKTSTIVKTVLILLVLPTILLLRLGGYTVPIAGVSAAAFLRSQMALDAQSLRQGAVYGCEGGRGRRSLSVGSFNVRMDGRSKWPEPIRANLPPLSLSSLTRPQSQSGAGVQGHGQPHQEWGEQLWSLRRYRIADTALFQNWDLFAFQEVKHNQLEDLASLLGDEYDWEGVGRDDGKNKGEAVPVFWKRDRLERVGREHGGVGQHGVQHFWLSPTPSVPGSVGWDADLTRMCTHVTLRIPGTKQVIHVFSTHYDHKGVVARAKSSELIVQKAQEAAQATRDIQGSEGEEPLIVLIGDLNSPRNEDGWKTLVGGRYATPAPKSGFTFLDTALSVPTRFSSPYLGSSSSSGKSSGGEKKLDATQGGIMSSPFGPLTTFTGFEPSLRTPEEDRIDYIFVGANAVRDDTPDGNRSVQKMAGEAQGQGQGQGQWRIRTFGVVPNWHEGDAGWQVSDHRAVMARIERD